MSHPGKGFELLWGEPAPRKARWPELMGKEGTGGLSGGDLGVTGLPGTKPGLWSVKGRWCEVEGSVSSALGRGCEREVGPACRQRPAGPFPELTRLPPGVKAHRGYLEPSWEHSTHAQQAGLGLWPVCLHVAG